MLMRTLLAATALSLLGAPSAQAVVFAPSPVAPFHQSATVTTSYEIDSIALYERNTLNEGITNSFTIYPGVTTVTDPFPKIYPITGILGLGTSTLSAPVLTDSISTSSVAETSEHLVLAVNDIFATSAIGSEFSTLFPTFDENALIAALDSLAAGTGSNDEYSQLFDFSHAVEALNGTFASNGSFSLVAFSDGQGIGTGLAFTTTDAAVPEPATWALMISGFGLVGSAMRRNRNVNRSVTYA